MIQVLHRAFDILEYLSKKSNGESTLSDIADELHLNHGTCANIIKTMVNRGYIDHLGRKEGYTLGPKAYHLTGKQPVKTQELIDAANRHMKALTRLTNEGSILSVLQNDMRLVIHEEKGTHELQVANRHEKNIYRTSTGRIILAYYNENKLLKFTKRFGLPDPKYWPDVNDFDDLKLELMKIRKKGIVIQTSINQIVGVAVPILKEEKVVASLGIYLPESRYNNEMIDLIDREIHDAQKKINNELLEGELQEQPYR